MSRALRALVLAVALAGVLAGPASAAAPDRAAHRALALTATRLGYMRGVMATKWVSRSPVQDTAQEAKVLDGARDQARRHGLAPGGVAAVFRQEIALAKVVQLGWGNRWLLLGFPADEPVPSLDDLRAKLGALSPKIVDALAGLDDLRCRPHAARTLRRRARRVIRTRYVGPSDRAALVAALLRVRAPGDRC